MIKQKEIKEILKKYDKKSITIGVLGGHTALEVLRGAHHHGFKTLAVCQKGREKTYAKYYKTRYNKGIVDDVIILDKFSDITKPKVQKELRDRNTIFIHHRYFWVYCNYKDIENSFRVPIFGTRDMVKLEERNIPKNQYFLLEKADIRLPKIFTDPTKISTLSIVKVPEASRGYERAFFFCNSFLDYQKKAFDLLKVGEIKKADLQKAVIEEYALGAQVNFNYFYSPLTKELELMGTDIRRQTNLDGILRLPATEQLEILKYGQPKMIETGHVAITIKESLVEKAFDIGERFVQATQKFHSPGILGAFALQGAVVTSQGKEEIVIFDVSLRIPGSPGICFTPYSGYLYGDYISYGERIAMELKLAIEEDKLDIICT